MPNQLSQEELAAFRASVNRLAKEKLAPMAEEIDEKGEFPWQVLELFRDNDLLGLQFPEQYGGSAAPILATVIAVEEVARYCGNSASVLNVNSLAAVPILLGGSPEQKEKFLPPLARGDLLGAFALTEPNTGSDAAGITTKAEADGDHYVVNGRKCFISNGDLASVFSLFVKTDLQAPGVKGISALLVTRDKDDSPGFSIGRLEKKIGGGPIHAAELIFEDFRVPRSAVLGEPGRGFYLAMQSLDKGRLNIAATAIGKAQGALDLAVDYARRRVVFGKPVAKFQGIQWMLAEMATKLEAARRLTYHAAELLDQGSPEASQAGAMAKLLATDTAMEVVNKALQIHGGYGYMKDYAIQRYWREARLGPIIEGTNEIQKNIIARNLIGRI
ncbi:MAG: acyl-CoA dehydrogenase family protein [Proteobacteria bacterium]|nr:acyl-CoA dehydrogenase family protein [Pseudomonadota bacterium]MBU4384739.1 acyl-CoA dehydrogenase family protein [Pseudomonadota bacterium]MCG2764049.1 acyl-CoA dehydrogenase family protein [Desulfarculaceae bacterium]